MYSNDDFLTLTICYVVICLVFSCLTWWFGYRQGYTDGLIRNLYNKIFAEDLKNKLKKSKSRE